MAPDGWLQRWRALLGEQRPADVQRFNQGRAFQRSGRVASLRVEAGRLSGRVQGSRATPYQVEALVGTLADADWRRVVEIVAGQVRFAAGLLAGRLPDGLLAALDDAGVDLVGRAGALDARCACGEASRPCAHLVALWEQAAARFADDPFALFALRGRGRQRLLAELGALRRREPREEPTVPLDALAEDGWTEASEPLDALAPPPTQAEADPLRLLGDPPGWAGVGSAEQTFRPLVDRAAARARALQRDPGRADLDRDQRP